MFKAMILLTRREDMSHQEFLNWWINEHAPLAKSLPRLRKLTFNEVATGFDESGIDGIAELWFDSHSDFEAAYETEIGKATAADSISHVKGRVRLLINENEIVS
jgi:uncharacterized protein (TIGR02118 family)